jgi:hypothetical protein
MTESTARKMSHDGMTTKWESRFKKVDLYTLNVSQPRGCMVPGEARPRLITRSGFEQKHIVTSQIASG